MRQSGNRLAVLILGAIVAAGCTPGNSGQTAQTSSLSVPDGSTGATSDVGGESGFTAPVVDPTILELDQDIRSGTLENGLSYYVLSNDSPGESVSMRLAVKAGGYHEDPQGTGVAHFLEHMMFNGTAKYPGNQVDAALRAIGAEIGPDFNAYTSATETVYQISVQDSGQNVDTAVDIMAQWAAHATLDAAEVGAEAPVINEELRLQQSGDGLVGAKFDELYHRDTPLADVDVGGTSDSISSTNAEVLRIFYDNWYRPDNMAVVIVGDRPVDDLEKLVRNNFSAITARGQSPDSTIPEFELRIEPIVDVIVEPSIADASVSVDVPLPTWDYGTLGGQKQWIIEVLLGIMIDSRISEGVQAGRLNLERGLGQWYGYDRGLQYMAFNVAAADLELGAEVLLTEIESTIKSGFSDAELNRAIDVWRNIADQRLKGENDISDAEWANQLLEHFLGSADLQSTKDSVAMNLGIVDSLEIAEVNNHWGWIMTSAGPIVVTIGPDAETVGTPAGLLAALERSREAEASSFDDDVEEITELMQRPSAVQEIEQRRLTENPGLELTFGNGMRVLFSPSSIDENNVTFLTESPGGKSQLGVEEAALAGTAVDAVNASGRGPYSAIQMNRYLSSRDAALIAYVDDFSEGFFGGAPAEELEVLFQLMFLGVTQPIVEAVPFAQRVESTRDQLDRVALDSSQFATVGMTDARTGGERFALYPKPSALDGLETSDALTIYIDRFSSLDGNVILIVGDVKQDDVVALARSYVGSLPVPANDRVSAGLPAPGSIDLSTSVGSAESAGAFRLLRSGTGSETVQNHVLADVTTNFLNDRVFTVLREELGATYGGNASITFNEPGDSVDLVVSIDGDPARIDEIAMAVENLLTSVGQGQIDPQDFTEAVAVVRGRYNFINNGFIIESLRDEAEGGEIITRSSQQAALSRINAAALASFVRSILSTDNHIEVRNVPG